jgi:hypothetical protein
LVADLESSSELRASFEFFFDFGEGGFEGGSAVGIGSALAEYVFALELKSLALALMLGIGKAFSARGFVNAERRGVVFGLLFLYRLAFPTSGHISMLQGIGYGSQKFRSSPQPKPGDESTGQ